MSQQKGQLNTGTTVNNSNSMSQLRVNLILVQQLMTALAGSATGQLNTGTTVNDSISR